MGLDMVEVAIELEVIYEIEITDEKLSECRTVGDLHALVRSLLEGKPGEGLACANLAAFARLRRALREMGRWRPGSFRSETPLEDLFPKATRRRDWMQLARHSGLRLPPLASGRPGLDAVAVTGALLLGAVVPCGFGVSSGSLWGVMLGGLGAVLFGLCGSLALAAVLARFHDALDPPVATLGGLVRRTAAMNNSELLQRRGIPTEGESFAVVRDVIVTQACVDPEIVRPDADLYRDLGMG